MGITMQSLLEQNDVNATVKKAVLDLLAIDKETYFLKRISALLSWDQALTMPQAAVKSRAEQLAYIELKIHESITQHTVSELLHVCEVQEENQLGDTQLPQEIRHWLRTKYREWKKASSVPPQLVSDFKKETALASLAWKEAREKNDYTVFKDSLQKVISFNQNIADCLGYKEGKQYSRYDALIDQFEPHTTAEDILKLFSSFKHEIIQYYMLLCDKNKSLQLPALPYVSRTQQQNFVTALCEGLGFTKDIGHLGVSAHPFSVGLGIDDARITTRYLEHNPLSAISSAMHEMGHAFYDLGIASLFKETVCDEGASYGIHESQSRFFENMIGKHPLFWEYWYPILCQHVPAFSDMPIETFFAHLKKVEKQPIRVESDEIGYTLHIIVRFELEKALIEGDIGVDELPSAWNSKYKKYLGIEPKNYAEGVLQDVHWSEGYFGYFPSYSLGNLYSAQLFYTMKQEFPEYERCMQQGSMREIKEWLKEAIHQYGASKFPSELLPLTTDDFMRYIQEMYVT